MRGLRCDLDDEAFASFVASPFEDGPSCRRAHPLAKAVSPFSANIARLVCPFHCDSSVYIDSSLEGRAPGKERLSHHSLGGMSIFFVRKFRFHLPCKEIRHAALRRFSFI